MSGTEVDMNMVSNISKISGIDIMARIKDEQFYTKNQRHKLLPLDKNNDNMVN